MLPKNTKQWVVWKREEVLKQGVPTGDFTKIPYTPTGKKASSTNPDTWSTYEVVDKVRYGHSFDGIGFVFNGAWLGVDLDHVLKANAIQDEASRKFVEEANTLTEISPSGDGLHLYFKLSEPVELAANAHKPNAIYKYECYTEKRYFTVTENVFEGKKDIRTIDSEEAYKLLAILGYPWKKKEKRTETPAQSGTSRLSDDAVLRIMFAARNGKKMRDLYNGIDSDYQNDASVADAAFCSMLAFYTNKDATAMERIWLASHRGQREKTREREDYRKRTIDFAIRNTEETFKENTIDGEEFSYYVTQENKKGEVTIPLIVENIRYFLNTHRDFKGKFRYEEFHSVIEMKEGEAWRALTDDDIVLVMNKIARAHPYFAKVSDKMVLQALLAVSRQYAYDEVKNYLHSVTWDKKPRLDTWLCNTFGVENDEYHRSIGANWMKGLVRRAMHPGCKFDYVLVIEGKQGIKKSTAFSVLADPWHTETVMTPENKDFFLAMRGNLVIEFAEGETLSRGEMKRLKAVITMLHDDLRVPYGKITQRYPRRCVFAMTTNEDQYLKDNTGNRRWLPVKVIREEADIDWLKENRDQLFAEAHYRANVLNEKYWEFPKEEMEAQQQQRVIGDPQTESVAEWYLSLPYERQVEGVTTKEAFEAVQPINSYGERKGALMNKADEMVFGSILRNTLFLVKKLKMKNGINKRLFVPSDKTPISRPSEFAPVMQSNDDVF